MAKKAAAIILGARRFTSVSPTLVRMEFKPGGSFETRRSIIAAAEVTPRAFLSITRDGEWHILKTESLEIRTRENDQAIHELNLEVRWLQGGLLQFWRPGDSDYQNLGGTLRSLDRYGENHGVGGCHVADLTHPDAKGMDWLAWLQCETDVPYYKASPAAHKQANQGDWHGMAQRGHHEGRLLERTFNKVHDAHRFSVGILSRSGYFLLNDSESAVYDRDDFPVERNRPGYQDYYFFGYGKDYKQGLRDFITLCGRANLPTRNTFGVLFSRWPAWKESEARELVATFERNGYPLSTLVLDMEWHKEGWGHWEWDEAFYADPKKFFAWLHRKGIEITLNDHPLYVRSDDRHFADYVKKGGVEKRVHTTTYNEKTIQAAPVNITDKRSAKAFLEVCHTEILEQGIDYWWNDGTAGRLSRTWGQLVGNELFFKECARKGKRGMNLARYGGMGNHRYGAFFTGDTSVCWDILRLQVEFNIRAGHVGVSSVSHDLGGFCIAPRLLKKNKAGESIIDPILYLRWLQFGAFNPVMRFHCAPGSGSRQPWDYESEVDGACRRFMRLRNAMLPYIYTAARKHYDTGLPVTQGHFLDHPDSAEAYRFDQYLFGPDLLVAPVTSPENRREIYLPEGLWWEFEGSRCHHGGMTISRDVALAEIPVYVKAGSVIPKQDPDQELHAAHIERLTLDCYPGASGTSSLYEDDGKSPKYQGRAFCRTEFVLTSKDNHLTLKSRVTEGKPFGPKRTVTITLPLNRAPKKILLGRTELNADSCTRISKGRYQITLPATRSTGFTMAVEW